MTVVHYDSMWRRVNQRVRFTVSLRIDPLPHCHVRVHAWPELRVAVMMLIGAVEREVLR